MGRKQSVTKTGSPSEAERVGRGSAAEEAKPVNPIKPVSLSVSNTKGLRLPTQPLEFLGSPTWARTRDLRINRTVDAQLEQASDDGLHRILGSAPARPRKPEPFRTLSWFGFKVVRGEHFVGWPVLDDRDACSIAFCDQVS